MNGPPALEVDRVTVTYGGLRAVDDVSLRVPHGALVGLIGPNGAGKTTLFNAVTGVVRPVSGRVRAFGRDVTDWPPHRRARLGIGRTFQRLELFGSLTVEENLVVALESHWNRGNLLTDLFALPPTVETRAAALARAREVLGALRIAEWADARAADVPLGVARLVELGRALCLAPRLLLLDEPSSGLRAGEREHLAHVLRGVAADGAGVLLVEHDMAFVLRLCDEVYVFDFGRLIAHGSPAEVRADPVVQAAYLGEELTGDAAARG